MLHTCALTLPSQNQANLKNNFQNITFGSTTCPLVKQTIVLDAENYKNYKTRNVLWLHSKNNQKVLTKSSNKCKNIHSIVAIYKRTKLQEYGYVSTNICFSALMLSVNLFNGVKIMLALLIVMSGLLVRHEPGKCRERWRQQRAAGRALTKRLQNGFLDRRQPNHMRWSQGRHIQSDRDALFISWQNIHFHFLIIVWRSMLPAIAVIKIIMRFCT